MTLQVKKITDRKGMQDFLQLPYDIYRNDDQWVAPLNSEILRTLDAAKNPYFKGCDLQKYICYKGNTPVARGITVINPRHWQKFDRKTAFFGFFESEDDTSISRALFASMADHCRQQGAAYMEGPFNPNHYSELGLLVENFTQPVFFETYNPPYYQNLLKDAGFYAISRLHSRENHDARAFATAHSPKSLARMKTENYTIRPFNSLRLKSEMELIREVFNDAFSENWHFLEVSRAEYNFLRNGIFLISKPGLIQIVEYKGKPIAVLQCVLNVNPLLKKMKGKLRAIDLPRLLLKRKEIQELIVYAVGIKKAHRSGPAFLMMYKAIEKMVQRYPTLYTTWTMEENKPAVNGSEIIGMKPYKWFEVFEKTL